MSRVCDFFKSFPNTNLSVTPKICMEYQETMVPLLETLQSEMLNALAVEQELEGFCYLDPQQYPEDCSRFNTDDFGLEELRQTCLILLRHSNTEDEDVSHGNVKN